MKLPLSALAVMLSCSVSQAQSCGDLCKPHWWQTATQVEIGAAITSSDVNAHGEDGLTPLMVAAAGGTPEVVLALLDAGADGSLRDNDGKTAFDYAEENEGLKDSTAYWRLALATGADINTIDQDGKTALIWAAWLGEPEAVLALLDAGADVNARGEDGRTPLIEAAMGRTPEIMVMLLEAGADANVRDQWGRTALIVAAGLRGTPERLTVLLEAGADINAIDQDGKTALIWATVGVGTPEAVLALLDAGADGSLRDNDGKTAFDYVEANEGLKGTEVYWRLNDDQFK